MDFGKVESIEGINFSFPPNHPDNEKILQQKSSGNFEMYVGCSKWSQGRWVERFYPKSTRPGDLLKYYSSQFSCIELNATRHWSFHNYDNIEKWIKDTDSDFKFCPKVFETISHKHRLRDCEAMIESFVELMHHLGDKLGICFLQLDPDFSPGGQYMFIESFLEKIPAEFPLAMELRHPQWFSQMKIQDAFCKLLQEHNRSFIITDTPGRRDVFHQRLTSNTAFVRFAATHNTSSNMTRLNNWIQRIKEWKEMGLQKVYFFLHQPDTYNIVDIAEDFIKEINVSLDVNINIPLAEPVLPQTDLFS